MDHVISLVLLLFSAVPTHRHVDEQRYLGNYLSAPKERSIWHPQQELSPEADQR